MSEEVRTSFPKDKIEVVLLEGTNQVDLDIAASMGVPVFNSPFSNTRSVAELTLSEIISLHRRVSHRSALLHQGEWDKSADRSHEVRGRTLGIIGYGHIGSQISVLAEAVGMRVVFFDVESSALLLVSQERYGG